MTDDENRPKRHRYLTGWAEWLFEQTFGRLVVLIMRRGGE